MTIETDFFDPPGFPAAPTRVHPASPDPLEPRFPARDERRRAEAPVPKRAPEKLSWKQLIEERRRYG